MKEATWSWKVRTDTAQAKACKLLDLVRKVFKALDGKEYPVGYRFEGKVRIETFETVAETVKHYGEDTCLRAIEHTLIQEALNEARQGHQAKLGWTSKPESKLDAFIRRVAESEGISIEKLKAIALAK